MQCLLEKEINNCPFYKSDGSLCTNKNTKCSFRGLKDNNLQEKNKYIREPRWYEVYYK